MAEQKSLIMSPDDANQNLAETVIAAAHQAHAAGKAVQAPVIVCGCVVTLTPPQLEPTEMAGFRDQPGRIG